MLSAKKSTSEESKLCVFKYSLSSESEVSEILKKECSSQESVRTKFYYTRKFDFFNSGLLNFLSRMIRLY